MHNGSYLVYIPFIVCQTNYIAFDFSHHVQWIGLIRSYHNPSGLIGLPVDLYHINTEQSDRTASSPKITLTEDKSHALCFDYPGIKNKYQF